VDFRFTTRYFFDGVIGFLDRSMGSTGAYQPLFFAIAVVIVQWFMLLALYKNKIFLKV